MTAKIPVVLMPGVNNVLYSHYRITAPISPTLGRKTMIKTGLVMPVIMMTMMMVFLMTG